MKKAFTLVELLVALSIMALIMGLSLTAFDSTKKSARDGRRKADLESIRSALEIYRSDLGNYPDVLDSLVPNYIASIPTDPIPTQTYIYTPTGCRAVCGFGGEPSNCAILCFSYTLCATLEQVPGACAYVTRNP